MKILVIGSGGREHTIVWKLSQSPRKPKIYCAPGNAGTHELAENIAISATDIDRLLEFVDKNQIDLTIVGPEAPLVEGIVDIFEKNHRRIFGPRQAAALLEGSKVFSKELMEKYNIPTARARVFEEKDDAIAYLEEHGAPVVVKADGLAAGKGVIIAKTTDEAETAIKMIMEERKFGEAGDEIVIEELLEGEEASILAFCDGKTIVPMASSQDHKRIFDGDLGPNTGGMGAYSPAPVVTEPLMSQVQDRVLNKTMDAMRKEHDAYKGILYVGLMVTKDGPKVLEYNVRFGDPETQAILPRMKTDLIDVVEAVIDNKLAQIKIEWDKRPAVCVVISAKGYPDEYEKGKEIKGLDEIKKLKDVFVFHAGTSLHDNKVLTSGGRVLGVTALGDSIKDAINRVYEAIKLIHFDGMHYRKDIGHRALHR